MVIREATMSDYAQLVRLYAQLDEWHLAARPDLFKPTPVERSRDYVRTILTNEKSLLLVAEEDGRLMGLLKAAERAITEEHAVLLPLAYVHISSIVVEEAARGRGVAQALIEAAKQWAKARGFTQLDLNVYDFNQAAIRAYEKAGFVTRNRNMWLDLGDGD